MAYKLQAKHIPKNFPLKKKKPISSQNMDFSYKHFSLKTNYQIGKNRGKRGFPYRFFGSFFYTCDNYIVIGCLVSLKSPLRTCKFWDVFEKHQFYWLPVTNFFSTLLLYIIEYNVAGQEQKWAITYPLWTKICQLTSSESFPTHSPSLQFKSHYHSKHLCKVFLRCQSFFHRI